MGYASSNCSSFSFILFSLYNSYIKNLILIVKMSHFSHSKMKLNHVILACSHFLLVIFKKLHIILALKNAAKLMLLFFWFLFLLLNGRSCLHILEMSPYWIFGLQIFSPILYIFTPLVVSFDVQKLFSLMQSHLSNFSSYV